MAAAFRATVLMRSNSRISRQTSCEAETHTPGRPCLSQSRTRASLSGFWNELRRQTATASLRRLGWRR